jgi:hypothetical protein
MSLSITNFSCDLPIVHKTVVSMDEYINGNPDAQLAKLSGNDLGTTMERRFTDLIQACDSSSTPFKGIAVQHSFNSFNSLVSTLPPPERERWADRLSSLAKSDPSARTFLPAAVANSSIWNSKGGMADMWNANLNRTVTLQQNTKIAYGQASFEGSRSAAFSPSSTLNNALDRQTRQNYDFATQVAHKLDTVAHLPNPIGGVTTQAANTHIEDRLAYFFPGYGLYYETPNF